MIDPKILEGRHASTVELARWFTYDHLYDRSLREASEACKVLASYMIRHMPDGPELSAGLRKLLEAKDCFVRQALVAHDHATEDR